MQSKVSANMALLSSEEIMKSWMAFGTGAQEHFRKLMDVSLKSAK
jgi:hypothetical protein